LRNKKEIQTGDNFVESDEAILSKSETKFDKDIVALDNNSNVSGSRYRILSHYNQYLDT
jgi:hypothetical protein